MSRARQTGPPTPHPRHLLLELIEGGPPAFGRAHRGGHGRIDESIGLHHVHPNADPIVGKVTSV